MAAWASASSIAVRKPASIFWNRGDAFDADDGLLRLVSEAYRIRLAYLFDPYLAVSASQIEALHRAYAQGLQQAAPRDVLGQILDGNAGLDPPNIGPGKDELGEGNVLRGLRVILGDEVFMGVSP
jgi:hypothetical protein